MPPPHQPIHFIPKSQEKRILSLPIQQILAAPHHQEAGTNHWCFYLATSPTTSIQLDCLPSYSVPSTVLPGGSKANIVISSLDRLVSTDVEETFVLDVASDRRPLFVRDVVDLLIENGRHRYEFDERGVGCRFWVTEMVELFLRCGVVGDGGQVEALKAAVRTLWPEKVPLELDRGAYWSV
ncbi:uncharacterized protein BDW47DRAFT_4626 [Aspergillus candidus]|uniref:DUF7770 domain-containing protein n=1 Tax=Aspergillus candidus TaxID=41067 RepID=A0A2I2FH67_ASPCN|nr:hypothetical protein BDW47DRAFT_4626 [Aspergillus candidus]PLB39971.1 hypothetical protein BDW47DRAFT_4626 [Aspergillus candidus]